MRHAGRVRATDEVRYVVGFCDGTLDVEPDRLAIQGEPHADGRARKATVIERADVATLRLRCGIFGATLTRTLPSGYRSDVIRTTAWRPLLDDLQAHGWPVQVTGPRRPRS